MELGYFNQTKKVWINNRLDVNDLWNLVARGDTLTLWCTGVSPSQSGRNSKRNREERDTGENVDHEPPKKMTRVEERKALADEYEAKLKEKHADKYSRFQYKFWAEMLAHDQHKSFDDPPGHSMFNRESKEGRRGQTHAQSDETVVKSMLSVMTSLCGALTPTQSHERIPTSTSSPMRKAELRSTYLKQLSELRLLHESSVLSEEEYEEQRMDIVELMRQLKQKPT